MHSTIHFFVYGTLKRGQCRENCWPTPPLDVKVAWTFGKLYDLGPYPALLADDPPTADRVLGQLWTFRQMDYSMITHKLDQIEGTNQGNAPNEYDRVGLTVTILESGEPVQAQGYVYAVAERLRQVARRVSATLQFDRQPYVVWPDHQNCLDE